METKFKITLDTFIVLLGKDFGIIQRVLMKDNV